MPQAIDRLLATPIMRPRLPLIKVPAGRSNAAAAPLIVADPFLELFGPWPALWIGPHPTRSDFAVQPGGGSGEIGSGEWVLCRGFLILPHSPLPYSPLPAFSNSPRRRNISVRTSASAETASASRKAAS